MLTIFGARRDLTGESLSAVWFIRL